MGIWPPMGGLIPRAGPIDIIPREGPIGGTMERPLMWGVDIIPDEEDSGDWEELGSFPLQEEEPRVELEVSFLVEMQPLFCQSGSGPALPSFLMEIHSLFVDATTAMCLSYSWWSWAIHIIQ